MDAMLPADVLARVQITPQRLALADIATTPAAYHTLSRDIQAVGTIDYDQSRLFDLAARVGGRVDTLYVNTIGQLVKPGDALYSLYSPDVYTALREYLQARKRETDMSKSAQPMPDEMNDAMSVRQAAEQKLLLWGLTMPQLEKIAADFDRAQNVPDHIDILSTASGVVTRKEIHQGGYLQAGDVPFTVADLSRVWMNAKIYESDIPLLHIGQDAAITAAAAPSQPFAGKVTFLAFQLDPATRTLDARIEIPNPDLTLRPEMFATAMIHTPAQKSLTVPRSAVIDTGDRKIVYVRARPGVFDMRAVAVAPPAGDDYAVLSGLKEGENVVTRGAFLVDAEDRLNPARAAMGQ
jgi:Cu(I)/Ag(I) efflux system membrane fusion protein